MTLRRLLALSAIGLLPLVSSRAWADEAPPPETDLAAHLCATPTAAKEMVDLAFHPDVNPEDLECVWIGEGFRVIEISRIANVAKVKVIGERGEAVGWLMPGSIKRNDWNYSDYSLSPSAEQALALNQRLIKFLEDAPSN